MPVLAELAQRHIALSSAKGIDITIIRAYSTIEEQSIIYAKGRTVPGKIVTNAKPGYSWHNFGRAYDVAIVVNGAILWDSPKYAQVGAIGKALGLTWGGDFKSISGDVGHFEFHPCMTLSQARAKAGITV